LNNVNKTYQTNSHNVHAIRNLSLDIYEGDFTVIMGSSGSGKSTLLYLISGMDNFNSGEIKYNNFNINNLSEKELIKLRRKEFGMIYQGIHLIPYLTIFENVLTTLMLIEKNKKIAIKKSEEMLLSLDLQKELHRLPSQISGGQQQRAAVARALINNCNVLFADEPTGALNTSQGENLLNLLSNINNSNKSIIMVTHDLKAACRGNRILFLKDGKIEGELNLKKFLNDQSLDEREEEIYNFLRQRGW